VLAGATGYLIFNSRPESTGAFVEGFAAGALLTMLSDTMAPEAFQYAGELAGILTVAGFVLALAIGGA
jgi:ZIP family zinc transporter